MAVPWTTRIQLIHTSSMAFAKRRYGRALASLLFGDAVPSAKLPLTLPKVEN